MPYINIVIFTQSHSRFTVSLSPAFSYLIALKCAQMYSAAETWFKCSNTRDSVNRGVFYVGTVFCCAIANINVHTRMPKICLCSRTYVCYTAI